MALLALRKLFSSAGTCRRKSAAEIKIFVVVVLLLFNGNGADHYYDHYGDERSALDRRGRENLISTVQTKHPLGGRSAQCKLQLRVIFSASIRIQMALKAKDSTTHDPRSDAVANKLTASL